MGVGHQATPPGSLFPARPDSCPTPGQIPAFDAGWNAHEKGLARETVRVLTPTSGRAWALLGYDVRAKITEADDA